MVTLVLVVVIVYLARHEIVQAWHLLGKVNLWILWLILPVQALSYYAAGAMIFSYLRAKGDLQLTAPEMAKMALELNFVNHILPSGGVSGASYMTWRLKHLGVNAGRATLAQVVRLAMTFVAFLVLLVVAVLAITLDGDISRFTILVASGLASTIIFGTIVVVYVLKSRVRLHRTSHIVIATVNRLWQHLLRRPKPLLDETRVVHFLEDLHEDYATIARTPRVLIRPFWWGIFFTIMEITMFWITFAALGTPINPAPLLIAYGLAGLAGVFMPTPGGVGGYEAIMAGFLVTTGINQSAIIAAVLLARTILIIATIVTGYYFYQKALNKYGSHSTAGQ